MQKELRRTCCPQAARSSGAAPGSPWPRRASVWAATTRCIEVQGPRAAPRLHGRLARVRRCDSHGVLRLGTSPLQRGSPSEAYTCEGEQLEKKIGAKREAPRCGAFYRPFNTSAPSFYRGVKMENLEIGSLVLELASVVTLPCKTRTLNRLRPTPQIANKNPDTPATIPFVLDW